MSMLTQTIEKAMLDRAPALHRQLKAEGKLTAYLRETAAEINSQVVSESMDAALKMGIFKPGVPFLERVSKLKALESSALGRALAEALEFPQDDTPESDIENDPRFRAMFGLPPS